MYLDAHDDDIHRDLQFRCIYQIDASDLQYETVTQENKRMGMDEAQEKSKIDKIVDFDHYKDEKDEKARTAAPGFPFRLQLSIQQAAIN